MKLKGIDGDPHKQRSMWFNSKQREEPYLDLTSPALPLIGEVPSGTGRQVVHGCRQLVSWDVGLSPATSATLIVSCYHLVEHSSETARVNREEGGDDVKSSCPLCLGLHTCYNGKYKETQYREVEQNSKTCLSSDCRLKLAYMKLELLVIANQHVAVNTFPGLVHTARHTMRVGNTQSAWSNSQERKRPKVGSAIGVKS